MRKTRDVEHDQAVRRRLEMLTAELNAVRVGEPEADLGGEPVTVFGDTWNTGSYVEGPPDTHTRLRVDPMAPKTPSVAGADEQGAIVTTVLPLVGRHAHRLTDASGGLARVVRVALGSRLPAIGPGQLAVVALALVVALAGLCVWLLQRQPEDVTGQQAPIAQAAPLDSGSGTGADGDEAKADEGQVSAATGDGIAVAGRSGDAVQPDSGTRPADQGASVDEVVVHVAGKVKRPGIEVLPVGSRVIDAVRAAGGARRGVDLDSLNLARPLVDGEQILVGEAAPAVGAGQAVASTPAAGGGALVNINTAGQAELEALPEVGPVTATAIMSWRDANGGFTSVDELLEVDGIGEATLAQIEPHVTL